MREAYAEIDYSRQYTLCSKCNHDIRNHESVEDYMVRLAGACTARWLSMTVGETSCSCKQYYPGRVVTQKELDEEAAAKLREAALRNPPLEE